MKMWGEDTGDLAGLISESESEQGLVALVICESCGPTQVDHTGECVLENCEECKEPVYA